LGKWILEAPEWDSAWPVVEPEPAPEPKQSLPRLK
jgi:hypothetical protein